MLQGWPRHRWRDPVSEGGWEGVREEVWNRNALASVYKQEIQLWYTNIIQKGSVTRYVNIMKIRSWGCIYGVAQVSAPKNNRNYFHTYFWTTRNVNIIKIRSWGYIYGVAGVSAPKNNRNYFHTYFFNNTQCLIMGGVCIFEIAKNRISAPIGAWEVKF